MRTLYDIGDEIKITLEGKIIEYSASKDGDCYVIELTDPKQRGNRVYLSDENLRGRSCRIGNREEDDDYCDLIRLR